MENGFRTAKDAVLCHCGFLSILCRSRQHVDLYEERLGSMSIIGLKEEKCVG